MKITDLNIDCLEKVFRYLDYIDIFNVAESNTRLREAAKVVYRIKYRKTRVEIRRQKSQDPIDYRSRDYTNKPNSVVFIDDLKIAFKLLRYFENSISCITIYPRFEIVKKLSKLDDIACARLISYVHQFHSEFLTTIDFRGNFSAGIEFNKALENIETPFFNVKSIEMSCAFDFNRHFLRLFPNIQKINYAIAKHKQIERINNHFPCLKHVGFSSSQYNFNLSMLGNPEFLEMIPHMVSFLRLNPQIRSLSTFFIFSETFLDAISESLPLLESLELHYAPKDIFNFGGNFKNLKRVHFFCELTDGYDNNMETVSKRMKRVLSFDQLEEFVCRDFGLDNQDLYDILGRYPTITKLKLINNRSLSNTIDPLELTTALGKLKEIDFSSGWIPSSVDDPIPFIHKINSLEKFSLSYCTSRKRHEDLEKRLPTGWHATRITYELNGKAFEQIIMVKQIG